jgi:hypothetical protein
VKLNNFLRTPKGVLFSPQYTLNKYQFSQNPLGVLFFLKHILKRAKKESLRSVSRLSEKQTIQIGNHVSKKGGCLLKKIC